MLDKSKILMVDDRPANMLVLRQMLESCERYVMPAEIITAESGREAIDHTRHYDFAVILIDVVMPEMNGYELAEFLRRQKETQSVPIILMSAVYSSKDAFFKGYEAGAVDFLVKPIAQRTLVNKVQTFVEMDQQRKSLRMSLKMQESLKEQAEAANRAKSQFMTNITHDIRTPLSAIMGLNQVLINKSSELALPDEFPKFQHHIQSCAQNLLSLVNNFLDISKIESGKMEIFEDDFNIRAMIGDILGAYNILADQKGVDFSSEVSVKLPSDIRTDRSKLTQIISNLVGNAIKFTPKGRRVELGTTMEQGMVVITVVDHGIGIPLERQQVVFDEYEQVDDVTSRNHVGTGLGLAITKKLVTLLGGTISLSSRGEGKGCSFRVAIPFKAANAPVVGRDEIVALEDGVFSRENVILLVEDDPTNRVLIKYLFKTIGLKIHMANNGELGVKKAIELAGRGTPPDLILMDMQMPVMNGIEAARQIKENKLCGGAPVVAISALAFAEQQADAQAAGICDYLTKPLNIENLGIILHKYLAVT